MKSISKFSWGIEAYIKKMFISSVGTMYTDLGRPGDTFTITGD